MGHIRLETDYFWPIGRLERIDHRLPAMHAAPADFAFRREALAVRFSHVAGFAEGLGDQPRIAGGVLRPVFDAARRIDTHDARIANAEITQLLADGAGLANHFDEALAIVGTAHGRAASDRRPNRRDERSDGKAHRSDLVG